MSLPFLQPKKVSAIIHMRKGKPDVEVNSEVEAPGSEVDPALKDAMSDLLSAVQRGSVMDMVKAFQAGMDACGAKDGPMPEGEV